jgi:hypothetical protein
MYEQPATPPVNDIGDSFGWPFRDPEWVSKILLQGLINIIPIAGQMALFGWLLGGIDNLRQDRAELTPAGFNNFARGAILWLVVFVYAVVIAIVAVILAVIGLAAGGGDQHSAIYGVFQLLQNLWSLVAEIALGLAFPTILLLTDREGFGGGLNVPKVISTIQLNPGKALLAGLFAIIANIISGLGILVCCVGIIFTAPYAAAILAGATSWLERNLPMGSRPMMEGPSQPPSMQPPPAPPPAGA